MSRVWLQKEQSSSDKQAKDAAAAKKKKEVTPGLWRQHLVRQMAILQTLSLDLEHSSVSESCCLA